MYSLQRALSTFANGMIHFFISSSFSLCTIVCFSLLGSISHPKLCPPHIKRLSGLHDQPLFVLEVVETAHIVHLVEETVTDIAVRKMKVHQENIGHNSMVWVGVLLGIRDFYMWSLGARSFFTYIFVGTAWLSAYLLSTPYHSIHPFPFLVLSPCPFVTNDGWTFNIENAVFRGRVHCDDLNSAY